MHISTLDTYVKLLANEPLEVEFVPLFVEHFLLVECNIGEQYSVTQHQFEVAFRAYEEEQHLSSRFPEYDARTLTMAAVNYMNTQFEKSETVPFIYSGFTLKGRCNERKS